MKAGRLESLLIAVICACCASVVKAAPSLFSDYGQIQNVQHYSSSPFWSPNSPYNQRLPQPVYVQGTDLDAGDCMQVVSSLVSAQCMARDNCKDTALNDIRPTIMVQLSGLPGNNYVSACSGFIDTAFESYVQQYANSLPNRTVDFPNGSVQNQNATGVTSPQKSKLPQWQQEIQERSDELQRLQAQNGAGYEHLSATDFPTTYADLSFSERMQNAAEGYVPFKDMKTYQNLNVKNSNEWCDEHPNSSECEKKTSSNSKSQTAVTQSAANSVSESKSNKEQDSIIQNIVKALDPTTPEAKVFLTDLVTSYVKDDEAEMLDDSFVYNFLSEGNNLEKYKTGLLSLNGTAQDIDLGIDLDWEDIRLQISTVLDAGLRRRGALVCENNRSYEVGIDTAAWVATAVAAIASFGTGGVAVAGGRAAIGAGLKALAKGTSKIGLKTAAKAMSKQGSKQLAKAAVKTGFKKTGMKGWATYQGKGLAKHIAKKAGANLATKRGILLASGAVTGAIYETIGTSVIANNTTPIKTNFAHNAAGLLYSLVSSDISTEIINCRDLDYDNTCYAVCGHSSLQDDLNTKVFNPILGEKYCINEQDYTLYNAKTGKPLLLNSDDYIKITQKIRSEVIDKGNCDWNEDDVDMYVGSYIYDPDKLEPSSNLIIEEVIRLDD